MLRYKTFLLSKHSLVEYTQDWLEVDADAGLFCVADGVSNSYHPEVLSKALCRSFIAQGPFEPNGWQQRAESRLLPAVSEIWTAEVNAIVANLSGRPLRHEEMRRERFGAGYSTFVGLSIDEKEGTAKFAVIGDSTLFALLDGGYRAWCTSEIDDVTGLVNYNSNTDAVGSNLELAGEWLCGSFPLGEGYIVLLTDAMAKWFQTLHHAGKHPENILWALIDNSDFEQLADYWRADGEMDDDLSVIIIKLGDDEIPVSIPDPEDDPILLPAPFSLLENALFMINPYHHGTT